MNLNIFVFLQFILFIFLQYSRANKEAHYQSVRCKQSGGAVLVMPNCQSCPEGNCGGDCETAAGSTKCVLRTSAKTSSPKASEPSNASTEPSSANKTASNRLLDMSGVSTSISNATSSSYPTKGPSNIQSMESAKTTEFLPSSSEVQGNLNTNNAPLNNEITQKLVTGVAVAHVLLKLRI